jgi:hypothetical protein
VIGIAFKKEAKLAEEYFTASTSSGLSRIESNGTGMAGT